MLGRTFVLFAVAVLAGLAPAAGSDGVLFEDDFGGDLSLWEFSWEGDYAYGIMDDDGTPPPCLYVDDYGYGGTEAVSYRGFPYVGNEFTFSTDMKTTAMASQRRATMGLRKSILGGSHEHAERLLDMLVYGDHPDHPHTVWCFLLYESGAQEYWEESGPVSISNGEGWHEGSIYVRDDMQVEFYVDDTLYYASEHPLTTAYDEQAAIYVGSRTSRYDNVVVIPEPTSLALLVGAALLGACRWRQGAGRKRAAA